jgi:hypothetical protein
MDERTPRRRKSKRKRNWAMAEGMEVEGGKKKEELVISYTF